MTAPAQFPVLWVFSFEDEAELARLGCPRSIPWSVIAPHEAQAKRNHDQSLATLADRGGLDPTELMAVLEDRRWRPMEWSEAVPALIAKIAEAAAR